MRNFAREQNDIPGREQQKTVHELHLRQHVELFHPFNVRRCLADIVAQPSQTTFSTGARGLFWSVEPFSTWTFHASAFSNIFSAR